MREVLDRLREAESALDTQLSTIYHSKETAHRRRAIELLWKAKKDLWWATMQVFDAFAGVQPSDHDK